MKKITKGTEPDLLTKYRQNNPEGNWDQCKRDTLRKKSIQNKLREDQGGLCAYCEIDLKVGDHQDIDDFRVEHFHPKSDTDTGHNWHLDWQNLLGCCHGGSNSNVVDANIRFAQSDYSCDVPKGDNNWDGIILNPLDLPATSLFRFSRSFGSISVIQENCNEVGVSATQAQDTIEKLRLDSERLKRLRKATLDEVNVQLKNLLEKGDDLTIARGKLASILLSKDSKGHWQPFFSTIRHYLGDAAERKLAADNYIG